MIHSPSNRSMRNTRCLKPGVILKERYKIEEVIGAGGFGITYRAWDPLLQAYVAIKEYYPSGIATRSPDSSKVCVPVGDEKNAYHRGLVRFLKEAQDVARFQAESNIVSIFDYLEENDTAYMVMEYLHGCTLKQYLLDHGERLSLDYIIHISLFVLDALAVVHDANMIHRDISPENIFICKDLTVKLIDFGAAKQVYLDGEQTMSVVLKPGYAPPEQYAKKDKQGPWTDIYALGATLYYASTGEKPEEAFSRVLGDNIKPVCKVNPLIPEWLSKVIMKAMSIKIEDRYQTVSQMREALLQQSDVPEQEHNILLEDRLDKKRHSRRIWALVLILLVVCFGTGVWFRYSLYSDSKTEHATPTDAYSETASETEATLTDAETTTTESATDNSDNPMVMHVPTKAELAEQRKYDQVLTMLSSETERVSIDAFEYMKDANLGVETTMTNGVEGHKDYSGDDIKLTMKYYDSLLDDSPQGGEGMLYSYTFTKYDEDYGIYKPIRLDEWDSYDYAIWYSNHFEFQSDSCTVYFPLASFLEDGQYQLHFEYNDRVTKQPVFQTTISFYLYRGAE